MLPEPRPTDAETQDDPVLDNTVELTLDEAEALDLQAYADQAAEEITIVDADSGEVPDQAEAKGRIQELERLDKEHQDKHHRLLADFANFRNRTSREIQLAVELSEKKLLLEILPVLDNFERCLAATYADQEACLAGVRLIQKQFVDALRKVGVEPVALQVGDPFDAAHAEALTTMQNPALPDHSVAAVYEPGYTLRESLLRPAKVVVNNLDGFEPAPGTENA